MATSTNVSNHTNLFIIEVNYTASLEVIDSIVRKHRAYLAQGYEAGFLLASGPRNPKTGGIIIGRFASLQEARDFTKNDPYYLKNAANYEIIEFNPVLFDKQIKDFLGA
ncbi:YciI family protein [Helicobacter sp. T3_23-1056]